MATGDKRVRWTRDQRTTLDWQASAEVICEITRSPFATSSI